jgi:hypothetical protein
MKMRTIKLNPKFLTDAIQGKSTSYATNIPEDAQLLDIKFDIYTNEISAVIRSEGFEGIAEQYPIPELKIAYQSTPKAIIQQQPKTDSASKATAPLTTKPEPVKRVPAQSNSFARDMEEEFSPEQKRLLSFKVEGEYLIAKPNQFLKGEWEDINEVVKSLGGKWVKGDIVSYWQIPLP